MQKEGPTRSALDGTITEFDIATESADIDLRAFFTNNAEQMRVILQRELDANM